MADDRFSDGSDFDDDGYDFDDEDLGDDTMAEKEDDRFSDGSDFDDVGYDVDEDLGDDTVADPNLEPLDRDQWVRMMFEDDEEEDDDEQFEGCQDQWETEHFQAVRGRQFKGKPGVKPGVELPTDITPIIFFEKIFTTDMWDRLVTETNRYAEQSRHTVPPGGKAQKWTAVSLKEMKTFIGLCMAMGILRLPVRSDYWRLNKPIFKTTFGQTMAKDRFDFIWRYLHLQDNQAQDLDTDDKLWKLRWFLEFLNTRFQELYEVNGTVSIDESMTKFKGRLGFRQYLPMKPTKWGVKVWVMAESSTGYVPHFTVYTGREGAQQTDLAQRVVMDLARPYFGTYLSIYMDNFYTSVELLEDMSNHGLKGCGTIRANRKGLPKNERLTKRAALRKHDFRVAQRDRLTFCVWQDTKTVMVLSNHHDPRAMGTVRRRSDGVHRSDVVVPASLADYQKHMKGVVLLDQMIGYYAFGHRSNKWWRRIFFWCLSVSCNNAFITHRSAGGKYRDWLKALIEQLITPVTVRAPPVIPPPSPPYLSSAPSTPSRPDSPFGSPTSSRAASPAPSTSSRAPSPKPSTSRGATGPPQHDFGKVFQRRKICRECQLLEEPVAGPTVYGCTQCDVPLHMECFGKHYRRFL